MTDHQVMTAAVMTRRRLPAHLAAAANAAAALL